MAPNSVSLQPSKRVAAFWNMAFGTASLGLNTISGLLLIPWYLKHFDLQTYGAWLASGNVITMVTLLESGLSTVLTQRLAQALSRREPQVAARLIGSALVISCVIGVVVSTWGIAIASILPIWVHAPVSQRPLLRQGIVYASLGAGGSILFYTLGAIPQAYQRTRAAGMIGLLASLFGPLAVIAGIHSGMGVSALGLGSLAVSVAYISGYLTYLTINWSELVLPKPMFCRFTAVGIVADSRLLLISRIAARISSNAEATLAALFISPQASAVLVLTGRVVSVVQMLLERIGSSTFAGMALLSASGDKQRTASRVLDLMVAATAVAGCGMATAYALSGPVIRLWIGPSAFGGEGLLGVIIISAFANFRANLQASLCTALGEVRRTASIQLVEAFARPALIGLCAGLIGLVAIPVAGGIASLVSLLLTGRLMCNNLNIPLKDLFLPALPGLIAAGACGYVWSLIAPDPVGWRSVGVQSVTCSIVIAAAALLCEPRLRLLMGSSSKAPSHAKAGYLL